MYKLKEAFETPRGVQVWYRDNGVGGRLYICDDIGGGRVVWDTSIDDINILNQVLGFEYKLNVKENPDKYKYECELCQGGGKMDEEGDDCNQCAGTGCVAHYTHACETAGWICKCKEGSPCGFKESEE